MITIENDHWKASFLPQGAEWRSWFHKASGRELLWQADAAYWGKSAPVLFPIVGSLKDGRYEFGGQSYALGRHGFARDREFAVTDASPSRVVFSLSSDAETRKVYPFDWTLEVEYSLEGDALLTTFRVNNRGTAPQWFSVGAHPAFNLPAGKGQFEDGWLEFEHEEPLVRWLLNAQGTLSGETRPIPQKGRRVEATRPLFAEDALVLKGLKSRRIALHQKNAGTISMDFPGFPLFGIWTAPNAPFLCLEPWCGVADASNATGRLEEKEGIERLEPGKTFTRTFTVSYLQGT